MSRWFSRTLVVAAGLFLGGWALVLVSNTSDTSNAGSELLWRVGGLAVYASVPAFLIAASCGLVALLSARSR
jgi:hypothetical protein